MGKSDNSSLIDRATSQAELNADEIIRLLIRRQIELNSLLEVTHAINSNFSANTLFSMYEFMLKRHLHIHKLTLLIFEQGQWNCPLSYGSKLKFDKITTAVWDERLGSFSGISTLSDKKDALLGEFDLLIPVLHKKQPLAYVLIGGYERDVAGAENDIKFIQTITNVIVVAIENKKLFREQLKQEGLKKEMALAGEVQAMLVPASLPNDKHMEMAAIYLPHHSIGGDYYDCIQLNNHELLFCIADVSGKGISAALLMANFQANLRALAHQEVSLTDLVSKLNEKVFSNTSGEKFITLFVARYNQKEKVLKYINAGHNPPLLFNGKKIMHLAEGTTILGAFNELPFIKEESCLIDKTALLVCFTDGLIEAAEMNEREGFNLEELIEFIEQHSNVKAYEFNELLLKKIGTEHHDLFADDITVLSCRLS